MRKLFRKVLSSVLCLAMLLSFLQLGAVSAFGAISIDYGKNPNPDVDIAVSVPADYPGTFEDFKAELTEALIAQGMDPSSFRITDTAVKIDTTNLDGWYVYDHYYNQAAYNALKLSSEQQKRQPYRLADNSCMTSHGKSGVSTPELIQNVFVTKKFGAVGTKLYPFNQHTYSWEANGRANMMFAGYGTNALTDYMFYPAPSDSRRTIEFDLDCGAIDTHTLLGAGFLLNAAISNNSLNGYEFFINWSTAKIELRKIQNVAATYEAPAGTVIATYPMPSMATGTKLRIKVVLNKASVTVTSRRYNGTQMGAEETWFDNYPIPVLPAAGNGFGPIVSYKSHGCASMTYFQFGDLAMTYDSTAFDALKMVQYSESAQQKYFINLAGESGPGIPDASKDSDGYVDGITRMDQNEIFYVSNQNDNRVLTNDGIGQNNGFITSTETDFIEEMARNIAKNYTDGKRYDHANAPDREAPLANFYLINTTKDENGKIDGSQLMTVHQRHLINNNTSVQVSIADKSQLGNMETSGTKFTQYEIVLKDPDDNDVFSKTITPDGDGNVTFPEYTVDANSKPGRYTFQMRITDNANHDSGWVSTYFTVFDDEDEPIATGENTTRNHANIVLTDTGQGIDEDGITFIEDNRGSGVYAYYITDDTSDANNPIIHPELWIYLDEPVHQTSFDIDLTEYVGPGKSVVVYYMDECRNPGSKAVFKPIHVVVEDSDGDPIDDYYIIGETPVVILPDDVPEYPGEDPDYEFSNWEIIPPGDNPPGGGDPITSGTEVPVDPSDDEPTITIRPNYTANKVNLTFDANAADATLDKNDEKTYTVQVTENSDLAAKIKVQDITPVREGYNFKGWYLDAACTDAKAVKDQTIPVDTTVYAKWELGSYTLTLDHNGGSTSGTRSIANVPYQTPLTQINVGSGSKFEVKANELPTKEGYFFNGWYLDKECTQPLGNTTMPGRDYTVYAGWKVDTSKFVVHFDTDGGNTIKDKSYPNSGTNNYGILQQPSKPGYVFDSWYVKNVDEEGKVSYGSKIELQNNAMDSTLQKVEHTLIAKWTPATDTKVNVVFYLNSGNKDANGDYIYVRANNLTQSFEETTEEKITLDDVQSGMLEKFAELGASEYNLTRDYWLNLDVHPEDRTGVVTGGTPLELKLYYDRYFDVQGLVISGNHTGTVSSAMHIKEGTKPTITWQPADGYHTANIILDNRIRDGLLTKTEYTFEEEVHKDYRFRVRFDTGEPTPVPETKDYYSVATAIEGCYDGTCQITPSGRYIAGRDSVVIDWVIPDNYKIVSIKIDKTTYFNDQKAAEEFVPEEGEYAEYGPTYFANGFTRFRRIANDHSVVLTVEKLPTVGGNTTAGNYTVTVNTYGGDGKYTVTPSTVSKAGENVTVKWDKGKGLSASDYNVASIYVDGVKWTPSKGELNSNSIPFTKIAANHVVDIYFTKDEGSTDIPSFDDEEYIKLNTQIVGGPGTITNGGYVDKNVGLGEVKWDINPVENPDDPKYSYYEVESVIVNGEKKEVTDNKIDLDELGITDDADVVVNLKPVLYTVSVYKYGIGTTSDTRTYYKAQSYVDILGKENPNTGNSLVKVVVDGNTVYDRFNPVVADAPETASFFSRAAALFADEPTDVLSVTKQEDSEVDLSIANLNDDHVVEYYFTPNDNITGEPTPLPEPESLHKVTARINGADAATIKVSGYEGKRLVEGQSIFDDGSDAQVFWTVPVGYSVSSILVNGVETEVTGNTIELENITEDQNIVVNLVKDTDNTTVTPVPGDVDTQYFINTQVVGGKGEITSPSKYNAGSNPTINWQAIKLVVTDNSPFDDPDFETKYNCKGFLDSLADQFDPVTGKLLSMGLLNYDQSGDGTPDLNVDINDDGYPELNIDLDLDGVADHNLDTDNDGIADTNVIELPEGYNTTSHEFVVKYVIVDGEVRTDLLADGKVTFNNLDKDHSVVIVVAEENKPATDVDTDGDGEPDINIDKDGDGEPDVNTDVDGDGEPDVKIDTDGDGEPDTDLDEDRDGRVDTTVVVKYISAVDGEAVYEEKVIKGNRGDDYTTEAVEDNNYDITTPENANGVMDLVTDEVVYIYSPKATSVKVEFVKNDGEPTTTVEIPGHVFDDYTGDVAAALNEFVNSDAAFGYKLVERAENEAGKMTVDPITVTYKFDLMDSKVDVIYQDENGKVIAGIPHVTGGTKYNEEYSTTPDVLYGYDLDEENLPENASGVCTEDVVTVIYKYITKDASVNVIYRDTDGNVLDKETKNGKVFDNYTTEEKSFYGYALTATPANANGTFNETKDNADVVYTYALKDTSVIIKYVDEDGNELAPSETQNGKVFDKFFTQHKDITGYNWTGVDVVGLRTKAAQKLADFDGEMSEDVITVTYIYAKKDVKITVKHFDTSLNQIAEDTVLNYKYNTAYEVVPDSIKGYTFLKSNDDLTGVITEDLVVVLFYTDGTNVPVDPPVDPEKPDINIDTDGDGKPDINIDTDGDGEPDVNIDTDGDGEPDVNIDTDGDGEPDVNIDTDNDGKPDINIDTDKDGKPDINIDTDGDREPDINIDTDNDGKADINIDTTGDGKPNINIDTTGDGKADLNIDTDGDGKADVNIDTDGDGKADINIDTDGDGKADANLDTDGDGIADTNIIGADPVDTGSTDMFAMYAYAAIAMVSAFFAVLFMKKSRKEDEAEA